MKTLIVWLVTAIFCSALFSISLRLPIRGYSRACERFSNLSKNGEVKKAESYAKRFRRYRLNRYFLVTVGRAKSITYLSKKGFLQDTVGDVDDITMGSLDESTLINFKVPENLLEHYQKDNYYSIKKVGVKKFYNITVRYEINSEVTPDQFVYIADDCFNGKNKKDIMLISNNAVKATLVAYNFR